MLEACNFIKKETPAQVFSCGFLKILKNTFFTEHLRWLLLQVSLLISCKIYLIIMFSCKQKSSNTLQDLRASVVHKLPNEVFWYVHKNVNSIIPICLLVFYHLCQSLLVLLLPFINSAISNVISNYFYSSLHFTQIFLSK